MLSESWDASHTRLTLALSGVAGRTYELSVWNPTEVASIEGGKLTELRAAKAGLVVEFAKATSESYVRHDVVLHFVTLK